MQQKPTKEEWVVVENKRNPLKPQTLPPPSLLINPSLIDTEFEALSILDSDEVHPN